VAAAGGCRGGRGAIHLHIERLIMVTAEESMEPFFSHGLFCLGLRKSTFSTVDVRGASVGRLKLLASAPHFNWEGAQAIGSQMKEGLNDSMDVHWPK
jgi:hypothetical protein